MMALLINCGGSGKSHPLQTQFESERATLWSDYKTAKNEIKKSAISTQ